MGSTVVSGIGLISSAGIGREKNVCLFAEKRSGIRPIDRFELPPQTRTGFAGLIPSIPWNVLPPGLVSRMNEEDLRQDYVKAAVHVVQEAIDEAGIAEAIRRQPRRTALLVASSLGNYLEVAGLVKDYFLNHLYKITSLIHGMNSYLPARLADLFGIKGPCWFISSSCSSSLNAILQADRLIKTGVVDRAVVVGVDVCLETGTFHLWNKIRVLSHRNDDPGTACRPYCRTRDGLVVAEAAGCFVLEREGEARPDWYGRILGFGLSNGSADFLKPSPADILLSIRDALADADLPPTAIDFVAGSASGSPTCDPYESEALCEIMADDVRRVPLFAFKSFLGSTFGVQAISEGALALTCLRDSHVPEVRHVFEPDPRIRANAYYDARAYAGYEIGTMLFLNFGFAGTHMAVVYGRNPHATPRRSA